MKKLDNSGVILNSIVMGEVGAKGRNRISIEKRKGKNGVV